MTFSTGRGGAGNIQNDSHTTSENNNLEPRRSKTLTPQGRPSSPVPPPAHKVYYATGRGGAGNIQLTLLDRAPSPKIVSKGSNVPQLSQQKVTTGRGGYGNIINNDDPDLVRKLQDVDVNTLNDDALHAAALHKSFSVGRGGFGNVISATRSHQSHTSAQSSQLSAGAPNLYAISSHGGKHRKVGFMQKIKELFL